MSTEYLSPQLFIDGEFIDGKRETLPVVEPATGAAIGQLPIATQPDLDRALEASVKGFATWRRTSAYDRGKIMKRAADLLRERVDTLATQLTREQGKPLPEARAEIGMAADVIEWFGEEGKRAYGRVIPSRTAGGRQVVLREPVGPVAAFSPWNFPILSPSRKIAAALGAGCSCIVKPSEETPASALAVAKAFQDAGLPAGVLGVVFGPPANISSHLLASPIIRKLTFTGSTAVGKHLAKLAADTVKRTTMELGGHSPFVVFDDADIDRVADIAVASKYRNAGQVCVSPTRFLVQKNSFNRFVDRFVEKTEQIVVGNGLDEKTMMASTANPRRVDSIQSLIDDAKSHGAKLRTGGDRIGNHGFYLRPAVVTEAPNEARVMNEEPFGPLAIINPFDSFDDAVAAANRLPFGLAAYAFTSANATALALGDALEAGVIGINTMAIATSETPFGGMKESGYGSEGGLEGLDGYLATKFVNQVA